MSMKGFIPPVFTALHEDYTINYDIIPEYAKYLCDAGFKMVLVGGTTGEHMCFSVSDRKKLIEAWMMEANNLNFKVMAQIGGAPIADVLELASFCQSMGVHAVMVLPELYFKPKDQHELVAYIKPIAALVPKTPVFYYHIPSFSDCKVKMVDFVRIAHLAIPNFKGIKFTSTDLHEAAVVYRNLRPPQDFYLGADTLIASARCVGIKYAICTTFNIFPGLVKKISAAMEKGDMAAATMHQESLSLAIDTITKDADWVPSMKAAMRLMTGINVGPPCLPQEPLSIDSVLRISSIMIGCGLLPIH